MQMNDENYRAKIDSLIEEKSGEIVLNGSHNHASIILERMFAHAENHVRILTRFLDPRIYFDPDTIETALRFAGNPDRKISILVENIDENVRANLGKFKPYENVKIRTLPTDLHNPVRINFALMDEAGYRLERDNTGTSAIVSFGEPKVTPRLKPLFDKLWRVSQELLEV